MEKSYLKLPLNYYSLVKGEKTTKCHIEESIAQFIMMLITSRYGEVPGNDGFGSEIWELEFDQLVKVYQWESQVQKSILKSVQTYENRLKDIKVNVQLREIDEYEDGDVEKKIEIRRQAAVNVSGIIKETDQVFNFSTKVYISPLSQ